MEKKNEISDRTPTKRDRIIGIIAIIILILIIIYLNIKIYSIEEIMWKIVISIIGTIIVVGIIYIIIKLKFQR